MSHLNLQPDGNGLDAEDEPSRCDQDVAIVVSKSFSTGKLQGLFRFLVENAEKDMDRRSGG